MQFSGLAAEFVSLLKLQRRIDVGKTSKCKFLYGTTGFAWAEESWFSPERTYRRCEVMNVLKVLTLSCSILSILAQNENQSPVRSAAPLTAMQVVEAGPHQRTIVLKNEHGEITSKYQQIQTGLMRQLEDGSWVETSTEIELFEDGAIARQTRHQVIFSPDSNDANGVFDVLTPDAKRIRGRCIGLAYTDPQTGDSVFVAETKSVAGELVGQNEVIYRDCFVGDVQGDIRYRVTFSGLVQDVIIRSKIPSPDTYGLPNDVTLEVWTQFLEAPVAKRSEHKRIMRKGREVRDMFIDFGVMSIGPGRAFPVSDEFPAPRDLGKEISVYKSYERIQGVQFLIEMVPYQDVADQLAELPDPPQAARLEKSEIIEALAVVRETTQPKMSIDTSARIPKHRPLSIFPRSQKATASLKIKRKDFHGVELAGYVLDFDLNAGTVTNYTFRSDTTYYVTGTVYLNGATTIEGGTVIKFANTNSPQLVINVTGSVQMLTDEYNRAMFIAKDDDSVGAIISGSSGTPAGIYAQTAIGYASSTPMALANIHIRNADYAIYLGDNMGAVSNTVSNAQFVNCDKTIVVNGTHLRVRNAVFNNCTRAFWCVNAVYRCEHITFNQLTALAQNWGGSSFAITNSIFCNVGSFPSMTSVNNVTTNNEAAVFQQTGAGKHYLPNGSPYRDVGTTLIDPSLAADLNRLTTYSPIVLSSDIVTNTTLSRAVSRDVNAPDLGYHYAPVDYLIGGLNVTNASVLLTNGVAVGFYGTNGVILRNGSSFVSHGSPEFLNTLVRYQQVQDNLSTNLGGPRFSEMSLVKVDAADSDPIVKLKFSRANFFADEPGARHLVLGFTGSEMTSDYSVANSQFVNSYHSHHSLVSTGAYAMAFTNNLFWRSQLLFYQTNNAGYYDFPLSFYNNTLKGGEAIFYYGTSGTTWSVKDNFFNEAVQSNSVGTLDASFNAYRSAPPGLGGTNNVSVATADYVSGPLGRFYYPTSGTNLFTLVNAGSRSAGSAGLFHFTTRSAAFSGEGGTTVDIGFHYAGVSTNGMPIDSDGDELPDYFEDTNGNGFTDDGEAPYLIVPSVTNLVAEVLSGNKAFLLWENVNMTTNTMLTLERKEGESGIYSIVEIITNLSSYIDAGLMPGQSYTYRVKASHPYAGDSAYSNEGVITTFEAGDWPLANLNLWLRAANGVVVNSSTNVVTWQDLSGNNHHAYQNTAADQPQLVQGQLNSKPVVRFDGVNDRLILPNIFGGVTQAEGFVVVRAADDPPASSRSLWKFGSSSSFGPSYPATDGTISDQFGTSTGLKFMGNPVEPLTNYHLYSVSSRGGEWVARINGATHYLATVNSVGFSTTPEIGYASYMFKGDVAEIMVFDRVLNEDERGTVGVYLNSRYSFITNAPPVPVGLTAIALSASQVSLSWTNVLDGRQTLDFIVERKQGAGGVYTQAGVVTDGTSFIDVGLTAVTDYFYRVRSKSYAGESDHSTDASATTPAASAALPLANVKLWLKADAGVVLNVETNVALWLDQSGNNNHAVPIASYAQPTISDGQLNGKPVIRFDGVNDRLSLPNVLSGAAEAEGFIVLKTFADPPVANGSLWKFGSSSSFGPSYPATDGTISDQFGTSAGSKFMGNPVEPLTNYHLYNVSSKPAEWIARINGAVHYLTAVNSVGFATSPEIGYANSHFKGDIAEVLIFDHVLNADERQTLGLYLNGKYSFITNAPPVPAGLKATPLSPTQVTLSWTNVLDGRQTLDFILERKEGAGGVYAQVGRATDGTTFVDAGLTPATEYFYRIRSKSYAGESDYSREASATTMESSATFPLENVKLWLKADAGIVLNTETNVALWLDQSGNNNHAVPAASYAQPTIFDGSLSGKPALRFDGVNDRISLPNLLSSATEAEAFIVLKTFEDPASVAIGLWNLGGQGTGGRYPGTDGAIWDSFGSSTSHQMSNPVQPLNQYHLYNPASKAGEWIARINGVVHYASSANAFAFPSSVPEFGYGGQFGGVLGADVAEILIFNRVLTSSERDAVAGYLNGRHSFVTNTPSVPSGLSAIALSQTQVSLSWTNTLDPKVITRYTIERKQEESGLYSVVGSTSDAMAFLDTGVLAGAEYFYRLRARTYAGESGYSQEISVVTPVTGTAIPLENLKLWLKADAGLILNTSTNVTAWHDQSGNNKHASQTTMGSQPKVMEGQLNGRPALRFDGNDFLYVAPFSGFTQGEVFAVVKTTADPPPAWKSIWNFGTGFAGGYAPDGSIHEGFGSSLARNMGNPVALLSGYHVYNVSSKIGQWTSSINGLPIYSTSVNTVSFPASTAIGYGGSFYFDGHIAELLIFNTVLQPWERYSVISYLNSRYDIITNAIGTISLKVQGLSGSEVALSWTQENVTNQTEYSYLVERKLGTLGGWEVLAQVDRETRFVNSGLVANTNYYYRVSNAYRIGAPVSNEAEVITFQNTFDPFPMGNVALWLRAQDITNGYLEAIDLWPDFWHAGLAATQTNETSRPLFDETGLNGEPTVSFESGKFLQLPQFLTNPAAAEVFVVVAADTNTPPANNGLWQFNTNGASYFPSIAGGIQDAFGATESNLIVPPHEDVTEPAIYNISAGSNVWQARFNGPIKQYKLTNTFRFNGPTRIGLSIGGDAEPFEGRISEIIVFNRVLTLRENKAVRDCLAQKYGIALASPVIPTNLAATRSNVSQVNITWDTLAGSQNGFESYFVVERRAGTNLPYLDLATLDRTASSYIDAAAPPEIEYQYRLRAINDVSQTTSSPIIPTSTDTDSDGMADYLELVIGSNPAYADSDGDGLPDAWEVKFGLNANSNSGRDGAAGDFDGDGVTNLEEFEQGSDPADGILNSGEEILRLYRP